MSMFRKSTAHVFGWFMQRISALFLVIGMLVHFWVLHYFIEKPITFEKVVARLTSPGWILFDSLLLLAVIYHGLNGVWNILVDYNPTGVLRKAYGWILFLIGLATFVWGMATLIPFTAPV